MHVCREILADTKLIAAGLSCLSLSTHISTEELAAQKLGPFQDLD